MNLSGPYRPRVSRETRLLLITALLAVAALWVLARVRFPDRPAAPNPVQPLLTQLASRATFDDLASDIAELRPRLDPMLATVPLNPAPAAGGSEVFLTSTRVPPHGASGAAVTLPALRVADDVAAVLLEAGVRTRAAERVTTMIARDPASGLAFVRVPNTATPRPALWPPEQMQRPRYLIATDTSTGALSLHPVFIGSLQPVSSPAWPGTLWELPAHTNLEEGSFLFTRDAMLAGLVVNHRGGRALVPGDTLLAEAERVLTRPGRFPGHFGVEVQPLTPAIAAATSAGAGVVVTWVAAGGPAAGILEVGDVIEAADGESLPSLEHWEALAARLAAGQTTMLRVGTQGKPRDVALVATVPPAPSETKSLGLTLRTVAGQGAEILRVSPGSAASYAGLAAGDVITRIADIDRPSSGQVTRTFNTAAAERPVLVAFTRGDTHHVTVLER